VAASVGPAPPGEDNRRSQDPLHLPEPRKAGAVAHARRHASLADRARPLDALCLAKAGDRLDLMVVDMHMPEMSGMALARQMRQLESERVRPTPIIFLTSVSWRTETMEIPRAVYLTKPVKQSGLYDAIVAALAGDVHHPSQPAKGVRQFDPTFSEQAPLRTLLAEDNVVNQRPALKILERLGYRADVAGNGREVLEVLQRRQYDLIYMDMQMPEMDGLDCARNIRRLLDHDHRPYIVAMTANAMTEDRDACLAAGMDGYVSKPTALKELQKSLIDAHAWVLQIRDRSHPVHPRSG
jgi:CheY-like chemotaxis protein